MKILDRYIFTSFIKTFLAVFLILIFIFILQTVWLFIKDLAGKGLEFITILKFLWFYIPKLIPLVLPLTILLSSIMTFGSFAENYEFAAMKSTGISLQRAMGALIVFIVGLGISSFFFANNVIPYSEVKTFNMRRNLAKLQPALAITEGQFNDIVNVNIKVDEKYGDRDQYLKNVIIHEKSADRKNRVVIVSKKGELRNDEKNGVLQLILTDGNRYEDIQRKDPKENKKMPHAKAHFERYTMNIDISSINNVDVDAINPLKTFKMQKVNELLFSIDTLERQRKKKVFLFGENMYKRTGIISIDEKAVSPGIDDAKPKKDSLKKVTPSIDSVFNSMLPWRKVQVLEQAMNNTRNHVSSLVSKQKVYNRDRKRINLHMIVFHQKIALGFACIILFFVGAPLGAIIRKGGLGLPMVIAIIIFLAYHFIGIFGENSAEDGTIHPAVGAWLSTMIMFPLSVYLTSRATSDRGLINLDPITEPIKKFFNRLAGIKKEELEEIEEENFDLDSVAINSDDYKLLNSYNDNKLKDIVQNYKKYNYDDDLRLTALKVLDTRGITVEDLKLAGKLSNQKFEQALKLIKKYKSHSKIALTLYFTSLLLNFIPPNLEGESNLVNLTLTILGIISLLAFYVYLIIAELNYNTFFDRHTKEKPTNGGLYILFGPLYILLYIYQEKKMNQALTIISKSSDDTESANKRQLLSMLKKSVLFQIGLFLVTIFLWTLLISYPELKQLYFGVALNIGLYALFGYLLLSAYNAYLFIKSKKEMDIALNNNSVIILGLLSIPFPFVAWFLYKRFEK